MPAPAPAPSPDPFQDWFAPAKLFQGGQYPKRVSSALKIFPDLRFEIQRIVVSIAPRRALEIGPGDRPLISAVRGAVYLDIVSGFLGRLEGRRVRGDVREAPFRDDAFDLVVASDLLTHIPPPERALAVSEILRLAPRALFFNPEAGTPEVKSSPVSTPMIVETLEDEGFDVERRDFVAPVTKGAAYRMVLLFGSRKGVPATTLEAFDSASGARFAPDEKRGKGRL